MPAEQMSTYDKGLHIRGAVLGASHLEEVLGQASEFSAPLQALVTEYCWGAVWGRDTLDLKTRSMLNIAMLTLLNRQRQLANHVQGALRNGCSPTEIREVLIHTAVYCGVPAALEATRTAEQAITAASEKP